MNNLDLLVACVEQRHYDQLSAYALVDELMEAKGMTRSEADKIVSSVRRIGREKEEYALALALVNDRISGRRAIRKWIKDAWVLPQTAQVRFVLLNGDGLPELHTRAPDGVNDRRTWYEAFVSARWVLDHFGTPTPMDLPIPFTIRDNDHESS